jgi:hypothetical protein
VDVAPASAEVVDTTAVGLADDAEDEAVLETLSLDAEDEAVLETLSLDVEDKAVADTLTLDEDVDATRTVEEAEPLDGAINCRSTS